MRTVEIILILLYLVLCAAIGVLAQRRIAKVTDVGAEYYAAGRNVGTIANALAILAAVGSGGTFLAHIGTIWSLGIAYFAWGMGGAIAGFTIASVMVTRTFRGTGCVTVPSYFNLRYPSSKVLRIGVPLVLVVGLAMYLIAQLSAGGLVASYVTGLPFEWALVVIAAVFVLYTSMGGMLAVTWTNLLQGSMMVLATIVLAIAAIAAMPGSWTDFISDTAALNPVFGSAGETGQRWTNFGAFITWAGAICVTPHIIMRVFTAKSARSGMISMNLSMLIFGLMLLVLGLLVAPLVGQLDGAALESNPSDMWLLLIMDKILPTVLAGILTAAILAAVMSTVDSILLAITSAIGYDLTNAILKKESNEKQAVRVSRIASWVVGIVCVLATLNPPPLLIVFYTSGIGLFVSSLLAPLLFGIWWKRATAAGAAWSFLAGAVSFGICFVGLDMPPNSEVLISLPISVVAMIVGSVATRRRAEDVSAVAPANK